MMPWSHLFNVEFLASFFILIKRLFSFSSLSAIIVVSSAYLRLLILLLEILIPACDSSTSAYKLNKQVDNIQWPYHTPSPILGNFPQNQSVFPCLVLVVASWPVDRFLRRQVRWSGTPLLFKNIPQFIVIHKVKCVSIVSDVDVFPECLCFIHDPATVSSLISGSSASSKPSLYIWNFSVQVLLNPSLGDFEDDLDSMWNELNCMVVRTFFGIAFLWECNANWHFPVLRPILSFTNLLTYWVKHFNSIIF